MDRRKLGAAAVIAVPSLLVFGAWVVLHRPAAPDETPHFTFSTGGPVAKPEPPPEPPRPLEPQRAPSKIPSAEELAKLAEERRRAVSAQLIALRDAPDAGPSGCFRFESVGVRAAQRRRIRERKAMRDCDYTEGAVRCLETPAGWFVPFDTGEDGSNSYCYHEFWFVPDKAHEAEYRPTQVGDNYPESDLEFGVGFVADDVDRDGVVEAVLVRREEHPEGVGHGQTTYALEPSGEVTELPFDGFKDVDNDGRYDGLFTTDFLQNSGATCDPPDVFNAWSPEALEGPPLVAHRQLDGTFSITDSYAREALHDACAGNGSSELIARTTEGTVDEAKTLDRLVCQLANGASPASLREKLEVGCAHSFERLDCKKRRRDACTFGDSMRGFTERLDALPKKLFEL